MGRFSFKNAHRRPGVKIFRDGNGEPFENYRTLSLVGPSIAVSRPKGPHTRPEKGASLAERYPEIASEWHPVWNQDIRPSEVSWSSNYLFYWQCPNGHQWVATLNSRTSKKEHGCPCCSGREVTAENNLGSLFPDHAQEWHPIKNGDLTPADVSPTAHIEVFWKRKDYPHDEWKAHVSYRTTGTGTGGKGYRSKLKGSSIYEALIYWQMKYLFDDVRNRFRVADRELDIAIPKRKLGIEYDSLFFHQHKATKDAEKIKTIENEGWRVIRVRQYGLKRERRDDLVLGKSEQNHYKWDSIERVVKMVAKVAGLTHKIKRYLGARKIENLLEFRRSVIHIRNVPFGNSLLGKHPEVARYWDDEKNHPLTARDVSARDPSNYHFKCPICGHKFESNPANMVRSRTTKSKGCMSCTGRLATKENNLKTLFPTLVQNSWDYKRNKILPEDLCDSSNQYAYWMCQHCNKSLRRSINSVTTNQSKRKRGGYFICQNCKGRETREAGLNILIPLKQRSHPILIREWDPKRNKGVRLEMLTRAEAKKEFFWKCSLCGKSFTAKIGIRIKNLRRGCHGCPACRYERSMGKKAETLKRKERSGAQCT